MATASSVWKSCRRLSRIFRDQGDVLRRPSCRDVDSLRVVVNAQILYRLERVVQILHQIASWVEQDHGKAKCGENTGENLQTLLCHNSGNAQKFLQQWRHSWPNIPNPKNDWFPRSLNNYRAGSTTWPWTISPKLMVFWGVCWCYFDPVDENESGIWSEGFLPQNETGKRRLHTSSSSLLLMMRLRS